MTTLSRSDALTLEPALAELAEVIEAIKADVTSGEASVADARALIAGWIRQWMASFARSSQYPRWQANASHSVTARAVVSPLRGRWRWRVYLHDGSLHCEGWAEDEMAARAAADAEMGVKNE